MTFGVSLSNLKRLAMAWLLVLTTVLLLWCMSLQDRVETLEVNSSGWTGRLHGIASQLGRIESLVKEGHR